MKNKINLPKEINSDSFKKAIDLHLSNNLSDHLRQVIANILALDYATRLKSEPEINEYSNLCASRLKNFLQRRVVTEESFAESMHLFTIAISEKQEINEKNFLTTEKSQDALIDSVIAINFTDLSDTEIINLKTVLKDLLAQKNIDEIINFINSQPNLFRDIVTNAFEQKRKQQEIIDFTTTHVAKAINKLKVANTKITSLKNIAGKITIGIGLFATASIGLAIGGIALPILVVPSAIAAIKYAPKISNNIGTIIENNISVAKVTKADIIETKITSQNKLQKKVRGTKTHKIAKAKEQLQDKEQIVASSKNKVKATNINKIAKKKKTTSRSRGI